MEQFGTLLQGLASLAWPIIFALILLRAYRAEALRAGANEITASPTVLLNALKLEIS